MPRMQKLFVDGIEAGPHARPIEQTHVAALAQSMEALGLRTPIEVQMTDGEHAMLVTGLHRLMAARQLGWEEIEVRVLEEGELDEFDLQLWQIDENLMRRELSEPELAEHKARRQQIVEGKLSVQTLQREWESAGQKTRLTFLDWIKRQADGGGAAGGDIDRDTQREFLGWVKQQLDEQDAGQAEPVAGAPEAVEAAPAEIPETEADTAVALQDEAPAAEIDVPPPTAEQPAAAMAGGHPLLRAVRLGGGAAQEPAKLRARRASWNLALRVGS